MAKACIVNVNNRGVLLLEKLKIEGRIDDYYAIAGTPRLCFRYSKRLEITLDDYLSLESKNKLRNVMKYILEEFKEYVIKQIILTLEDGRIVDLDVDKGRIVVEAGGRNIVVCFKVNETEKKALEEEAEKNRVSISEYIRSKVFS